MWYKKYATKLYDLSKKIIMEFDGTTRQATISLRKEAGDRLSVRILRSHKGKGIFPRELAVTKQAYRTSRIRTGCSKTYVAEDRRVYEEVVCVLGAKQHLMMVLTQRLSHGHTLDSSDLDVARAVCETGPPSQHQALYVMAIRNKLDSEPKYSFSLFFQYRHSAITPSSQGHWGRTPRLRGIQVRVAVCPEVAYRDHRCFAHSTEFSPAGKSGRQDRERCVTDAFRCHGCFCVPLAVLMHSAPSYLRATRVASIRSSYACTLQGYVSLCAKG